MTNQECDMTQTYTFSYLPCQFCVGKNHCNTCGEEIARQLRAMPGVLEAEVNRPENRLTVRYENIDPEDLEDAMDRIGVFLS